jgi:hypothetical protein
VATPKAMLHKSTMTEAREGLMNAYRQTHQDGRMDQIFGGSCGPAELFSQQHRPHLDGPPNATKVAPTGAWSRTATPSHSLRRR